MANELPPVELRGASVLRNGALRPETLALTGPRIGQSASVGIDLSGYLLLPGIIDLHGDAFERQIAPRPGADFPAELGLAAVDREVSAHGITTAWLAQSWSWEGGMRGPDFAEHLLAALADYRPRALADLRVQIRCETHLPESRARLIDTIRRFAVDYVVFNDHLDEALDEAARGGHRFAAWAERAGFSTAEFTARLRAAKDRGREVPRHLNALAAAFDDLGVTYGSHDDPDGETRDIFHALGARICEFPTRAQAASVAKIWGDTVIMGAPNVVRGGSQSGNVSAIGLIARGFCDVLVSDYHYPALPAAPWVLADAGVIGFAEAWAMISTNPARVMGLRDRGVLEPGKRADIVVMNAATRTIEAVLCNGRPTYMALGAAARFAAALSDTRIAAE